MTVLLISLGAALVILSIVKLSMRPSNFPPGPRGLPLLGYITPLVSKKKPFYKALQELAKTYGPVTGFYLGPTQPFISVVGPQALREALQNNDLDGRPDGALLRTKTFGEKLGNASHLRMASFGRNKGDSQCVIRNDAFVPFGLGKRACLGEPLARSTIFLFLASLVKTFEFKSIPNERLPTMEPRTNGFIVGPHPFKAVVLPRAH